MFLPRPFLLSLTLFSGFAIFALGGGFLRMQVSGIAAPSLIPPGPPADGSGELGAAVEKEAMGLTPAEILAFPPKRLPALAAELARSGKTENMGAMMLVCSRWAELDPKRAISGLTALTRRLDPPSPSVRSLMRVGAAAILSVSLRLAPEALPELLAASTEDPEVKMDLVELRMLAKEMFSPLPASWKTPIPLSDRDPERNRNRIAYLNSGDSPEEVLKWWQTQPCDQNRKVQMQSTLRDVSAQDPDRALALAETLPPTAEVQTVMKSSLAKLAEARPSAALEYVVSHPGTAQTSGFLRQCGALLTAAGPDAVLAASERIAEPDIRAQLIGQAAASLAQTDPRAAARMMSGMEEDEALRPLWLEVAGSFVSLPEDQRSDWINSLPTSSARDAALSAMAYRKAAGGELDMGWTMSDQVAEGLAMLAQVEDPVIRARSQVSLILGWKEKAPNAATAWLRGSDTGLGGDIQQALLELWPGSIYTGPRP